MTPEAFTCRLEKILGSDNVRKKNLEIARNLVIEIACKHVHSRRIPALLIEKYQVNLGLSDEAIDQIDAELDDAVDYLNSLLAPDAL